MKYYQAVWEGVQFDNEVMAKLRDSAEVKQILYSDGPVSTSRVVKEYEELVTQIPVKIS